MRKNVLIIATSNNQMGTSGNPTGIWAEELIIPYYAFLDTGMEIVLASPKGGPLHFDPASLKPAGENEPLIERFLNDASAQQLIRQTQPVISVADQDFEVVFFPGGHGTMWDLPGNEVIKNIVERTFTAIRVVAAVCHGPAGLVSAQRPDGKSILADKKVSAFTNEEEALKGLTQVVPFLLESRITELGAQFVCGPAWEPFAVQDGNLITGQNPASSAAVAALVIRSMQSPTSP